MTLKHPAETNGGQRSRFDHLAEHASTFTSSPRRRQGHTFRRRQNGLDLSLRPLAAGQASSPDLLQKVSPWREVEALRFSSSR